MTDDECMADMCCKASPLCWTVALCLIVLTVTTTFDAYANWVHRGKLSTADAFVSCLNGAQIQIDDRVVTCKISKPLVGI